MHFCRLYLLGKCYFCKIKFRFYCLWKLFLNDAFVSSWASFLRRRSGLALEIPIFDQALLVLFWNNWTLEMYLLLSLFRKTIQFAFNSVSHQLFFSLGGLYFFFSIYLALNVLNEFKINIKGCLTQICISKLWNK